MFADCVNCAADVLIAQAGGPARDRAGFGRLRDEVRSSLHEVTAEVVRQVETALRLAHSVEVSVDGLRADVVRAAADDLRAQLRELIHPGFVAATGYRRLPDLVRYLRAMERRIVRLTENPGRDAVAMATANRAEQAYRQALAALPASRRTGDDVAAVRWMLQELRVSLFAQTLGTPTPVSETRIQAALAAL